ncbi:MAG: hypothetical protein AB7O96_05735, partial [Pseudobdellovibrionaceae bacterium]
LKNMKILSTFANGDLEKVEKTDEIIKPSQSSETKGIKTRIPAQRPPPAEMTSKFNALILNEMAHSAVLLAQFWDQIYEKSGKPNLTDYKSYKYPFTPEFVPVDYLL